MQACEEGAGSLTGVCSARAERGINNQLLPQLYLHGLALGDCELALRGLLGEGAPLSSTSLQRLKAQWQDEYATGSPPVRIVADTRQWTECVL